MRRRKPPSPRLLSPYGHLSTHLGVVEGADWGFVGIERCSSNWRVLSPGGRRGFCIAWLAISAPWSPVNKFTVLTIEDSNTINSELVDALPPIPLVPAPLHRPKWERRLPKLLSISVLDARETSLLLLVEIRTMDTSKLYSIKALLDSKATGNFIDQDFVHLKGINTRTLSHNIPVFNVNSFPNKAGQISEVVDILLHYKTYSKRMLLAVSRLGKQSLILGYNWLKDHNLQVD